MFLFGEIINYIIAKWRHSDVSITSVREKNDSVPFHPCTDTDTLKEVHGHWLVYLILLFSMYQFFSRTLTQMKSKGVALTY